MEVLQPSMRISLGAGASLSHDVVRSRAGLGGGWISLSHSTHKKSLPLTKCAASTSLREPPCTGKARKQQCIDGGFSDCWWRGTSFGTLAFWNLSQRQVWSSPVCANATYDAETERELAKSEGPIPPITEDRVTVSFARSGGPGGQNVNKVSTKVDMRFKVMEASWLPERVRVKLMDQEKNRINSNGELVVSSTRTRTQRGNIQDALEKLQAMISAAAYVPPEPSEEKKKRIKKLEEAEERRRLQDKKRQSGKKTDRRNKGSWD